MAARLSVKQSGRVRFPTSPQVSMRGSFNGKTERCQRSVKGSIPLPRTKFYVSMAERPNAVDCKSAKPPVRIWLDIPIFILELSRAVYTLANRWECVFRLTPQGPIICVVRLMVRSLASTQ